MDTISAYTMRTYTAGATSAFSSRLSNEFRLNYSSNETTNQYCHRCIRGQHARQAGQLSGLGSSASSLLSLLFTADTNFLYQQQQSGAQRQWNLVDTVSLSLGATSLNLAWIIVG